MAPRCSGLSQNELRSTKKEQRSNNHEDMASRRDFLKQVSANALAHARASGKNPQTPLSGVLPLTSCNPVPDTTVVTVGGTTYPTGVTSITNASSASKFELFDGIARLDIDTGHSRVERVRCIAKEPWKSDLIARATASPTLSTGYLCRMAPPTRFWHSPFPGGGA